jgi:endoglucanase
MSKPYVEQKFDDVNSQLVQTAKKTELDTETQSRQIGDANVQAQINALVVGGGTSTAENVQARVDLDGYTYPTIKSKEDAVEKGIKTGIRALVFEWAQGNVDTTTFADVVSTTRARTSIISFPSINPISIGITTGYKMFIVKKTAGGVVTFNTTAYTSNITFVPDTTCTYRFVIGKTDNSTVGAEIGAYFTFNASYNNQYVDVSISNLQNIGIEAYNNGYLADLNVKGVLQLGTLDSSGNITTSTTRMVTTNFVDSRIDKVVAKSGYEFMVTLYKSDGSFWFTWTELGYITEYSHKEQSDSINTLPYRIVLRKTNQATMSASDYLNVGLLCLSHQKISDNIDKVNLYDDLSPIDYFLNAKSGLGFATLDLQLETRTTDYINENGYLIGGVDKTRAEIKDWILNRNNCLYCGKLHKSGQQLLDVNNNLVELLGIGTHDLMDYDSLHTLESLKALKYYGVNCLRITAYVGDNLMPYSMGDDGTVSKQSYGYISKPSETKAVIEALVENCAELGIYAIIDWHVLAGDGDANQYSTQMQEFFTYFSTKYATYDNVLYELLNEPHANTAAQIGDLMKASYDIIHTNVVNPVIISGKASDYLDYLNDVCVAKGMDIFLSQHFYNVSGSNGATVAAEIQSHWNKGFALFCTEWGNANGLGLGNPDDAWATYIMEKLHSLGVSQCVWKFTYQNSTTGTLKWSKMAMNGGAYKYGGFIDNDLSHNGKFYFNYFKKFNFTI